MCIRDSLGIVASRKSTTCNITAFLVLSIIASLFAAYQFVSSTLSTIWVFQGHFLISIILLIIGLAEGVIAIVCSALCCGACCCGAGASSGQVLYMPVTSNVATVGNNSEDMSNAGLPSYLDAVAVAGTGQTNKIN